MTTNTSRIHLAVLLAALVAAVAPLNTHASDIVVRWPSLWNDWPFATIGARESIPARGLQLYQTDKSYIVEAAVPGIPKEKLKVSLESGTLTVSGEREVAEGHTLVRGSASAASSFVSSISLPADADPKNVKAALKDGLLTITIGRNEEMKPREIPIN
jgi:HSP20 family protein